MSSAAGGKVTLRRAVLADKDAVMSIVDVYGGRDYLFALYSEIIEDPDTYQLVVVVDNKLVGFSMTTTFDGGVTVMKRAGRVAENYRGRGFLQMMGVELDKYTLQNRPKVLYTTFSNTEKEEYLHDYFKSEGNKLIYTKNLIVKALKSTRPHVPEEAPPIVPPAPPTTLDVHEMSRRDLSVLFQAETSKARVFPEGRLFNFHMSYRLLDDNIPALIGKTGGAFYSLVADASDTNITKSEPDTAGISWNTSDQFSENYPNTVSENSSGQLKPSDTHRVAMVTFYFSVPTRSGYHYFVDVYTPLQMAKSESRDHLSRHLQRHLVSARSQFPYKKGVFAVASDLHLSKDIVQSCLHERGIVEDFPGPKILYLFEGPVVRHKSGKENVLSRI